MVERFSMQEPTKRQPHERDGSAALRPGLHLHFDPSTGIAGDMALAALVDAGVPETIVLDAIRVMKVPGLVARFRSEPDSPGLRFEVSWPDQHEGHHHNHRHEPMPSTDHNPGHRHRSYSDIRRMLSTASLPADGRGLAERMFARLAAVEAQIHNQTIEDVTFHEVGAFDSIADIVGVAAAIAWLSPSSVSASPPLLGSGTVECEHGVLPVPAPATASLLAGRPVLEAGDGELTTPTGALVLTSLVAEFGPSPPLRVLSRGLGIGTKTLHGQPNALAVTLGELATAGL